MSTITAPLALTEHFKKFLSTTLPPQERLDLAVELPGKVREFLQESEAFKTKNPHTRLVGSYAQDTSVGDIKDVDVLVFADTDTDSESGAPKKVLSSLRDALEKLPEALNLGKAAVTLDANRRSIHVTFIDKGFHLDIVPAVIKDGIEEPLVVPDKIWNEWIKTHPLGLIDKLNEINNVHNKKPKMAFRCIKFWFKKEMTYMPPKSYWLLAMFINWIQEHEPVPGATIGEIIHLWAAKTYAQYSVVLNTSTTATPNLPDPMLGNSLNVSHSWKRNDFESFMRHLKDFRDKTKSAIEAEGKDAQVAAWRYVFGDGFPESVDDEAKSAVAKFATGAVVHGATGVAPVIKSGGFFGEPDSKPS